MQKRVDKLSAVVFTCYASIYFIEIAPTFIDINTCQCVLTFPLVYIALDLPYIYPPTIVDGCDPERNEEYRMNIQAETDALINEYFNVLSEDD